MKLQGRQDCWATENVSGLLQVLGQSPFKGASRFLHPKAPPVLAYHHLYSPWEILRRLAYLSIAPPPVALHKSILFVHPS